MISSNDIQVAYVNLYKQLRKYIWDYDIVEKLADLEILVYNRFPDMDSVKRKFEAFKLDLREVASDDEELSKAIEAFESAISTSETMYAKLDKLNEVNV